MVVFKFKELSVILEIISLYLICVSLIFHSMSNLKKKRTSLWYRFLQCLPKFWDSSTSTCLHWSFQGGLPRLRCNKNQFSRDHSYWRQRVLFKFWFSVFFVGTKYTKYMSDENILVNLKFGQEFFMQREKTEMHATSFFLWHIESKLRKNKKKREYQSRQEKGLWRHKMSTILRLAVHKFCSQTPRVPFKVLVGRNMLLLGKTNCLSNGFYFSKNTCN